MGLPGLKIGPLDPDTTAEFGQVNAANSARTLIRLHAQAHPPQLQRALARPLDQERTKGLLMDEVRGYLADCELENGEPAVPKGGRIEGAQVRGDRDQEQVLTFTYRTKSGRSAKWFVPYDAGELPKSAERGDELVHIAEMREKGVVVGPWDEHGTSNQMLRRENSGLRRQVEALRGGEEPSGRVQGDTRPDDQIVADNETLRRENEEMRDRLAQLEALAQRVGEEGLRPEEPAPPSAADDEPIEGYDDMNAQQVIKHLRADETSDEERQRILEFERAHGDRRSVVSAAEQKLGLGG